MNKKSLDDRLSDLKPTGVNLNPTEKVEKVEIDTSKNVTTLQVVATENQLKHLISHMRMIRIKFKIVSDVNL